MFTAMQCWYALDSNYVSSNTFYFCTHVCEQCCNIDDLWFFSCIFNNCFSFCFHSGKHNIDCSANTYNIEVNPRTSKFFSPNIDCSMFICDFCPECFETFNMLINWTWTERTTTW